jgi:hypothetical protein
MSTKSHHLLNETLINWFNVLSVILIIINRNEAKITAQHKYCVDSQCKGLTTT